MAHLYGDDWYQTLRSIAGGVEPPGAGQGSQPMPPPAGARGPPAGQGRSLVPAASPDWGRAVQEAAAAVALPTSEIGEDDTLANPQGEEDDSFSEGSWAGYSSQDLRDMLRHFRPGEDDAQGYQAWLLRIASVLASRGEALNPRVVARYAIRASYAGLIVGLSTEQAGPTLRAAFGRLLDEQDPEDLDLRTEALLDLLANHGGAGETLIGRVLGRSRTPTVASGGGSHASPGLGATTPTPERAAEVGGGAGLGASPGGPPEGGQGAPRGPHATPGPWGPSPAAEAQPRPQQLFQQFESPQACSSLSRSRRPRVRRSSWPFCVKENSSPKWWGR